MFPRLWKTHPNFFITYVVTALVLQLGLGITQLVDSERYSNGAFVKLYDFLPIQAWGWLSIFTCMFMIIGLYYNFHFWGRLGLALGFFLCLSRGLLIELGPGSGGGLFVWFPLAMFHFAQLSEPTVNPLTTKE